MAKSFNKYKVKPNTDKPQVMMDPILKFFNGGFLMPARKGGMLAFPNNNQSGYVAPRMNIGGNVGVYGKRNYNQNILTNKAYGGDISIPDLTKQTWITKYANGGEPCPPGQVRVNGKCMSISSPEYAAIYKDLMAMPSGDGYITKSFVEKNFKPPKIVRDDQPERNIVQRSTASINKPASYKSFKNDEEWLSSHANWTNTGDTKINGQYWDDYVREKVLTGRYGVEPETGALVNLPESEWANVPESYKERASPEWAKKSMQQRFDSDTEAGKELRKAYVASSMQEAFKNPIMYAPAAIAAAPFVVGAAPAIGAAVGSALSAPLTIGSTVVPYATAGNILGLAGGMYSANQFANPSSETRQSISTAYNNPTFGNVMNATGNTLLNTLGVLGSPGVVEGLRYIPQGSRALKGAIDISKESGLLSNTYKINPFAFETKPSSFYRQVGESGFQNALQEGKIFGKGQKEFLERNPGFDYWDEYNRMRNYSENTGGLLNLEKPKQAPFFQKGELFFPRSNKTGFGRGKTAASDIEYLFEGSNLPEEAIIPRYRDQYVSKEVFGKNGTGVLNPEYNNLSNFKVYKKDWLRGYKPVEVPSTFKTTGNKNILQLGKDPAAMTDAEFLNESARQMYLNVAQTGEKTIQQRGDLIIKDLTSPEGVRRLKEQFRIADPSATEEQLDHLVGNRIREVYTALTKNRNSYFLEHGEGLPGTVTASDDARKLLLGRTSFNPAWNPYNIPKQGAPSADLNSQLAQAAASGNAEWANLTNEQRAALDFAVPDYAPGTIGLDIRHADNPYAVVHEAYGHGLQGPSRTGLLPLEEDLLQLVKPKNFLDRWWFNRKMKLDPKFKDDYLYFTGQTKNQIANSIDKERFPFLAENRALWVDKGLINKTHSKINFNTLRKAAAERKANPSDDNRFINLFPFWKWNKLSKIMNVAPAAIPLVGGAAIMANQPTVEAPKEQYGGQLDEYAGGGEPCPNGQVRVNGKCISRSSAEYATAYREGLMNMGDGYVTASFINKTFKPPKIVKDDEPQKKVIQATYVQSSPSNKNAYQQWQSTLPKTKYTDKDLKNAKPYVAPPLTAQEKEKLNKKYNLKKSVKEWNAPQMIPKAADAYWKEQMSNPQVKALVLNDPVAYQSLRLEAYKAVGADNEMLKKKACVMGFGYYWDDEKQTCVPISSTQRVSGKDAFRTLNPMAYRELISGHIKNLNLSAQDDFIKQTLPESGLTFDRYFGKTNQPIYVDAAADVSGTVMGYDQLAHVFDDPKYKLEDVASLDDKSLDKLNNDLTEAKQIEYKTDKSVKETLKKVNKEGLKQTGIVGDKWLIAPGQYGSANNPALKQAVKFWTENSPGFTQGTDWKTYSSNLNKLYNKGSRISRLMNTLSLGSNLAQKQSTGYVVPDFLKDVALGTINDLTTAGRLGRGAYNKYFKNPDDAVYNQQGISIDSPTGLMDENAQFDKSQIGLAGVGNLPKVYQSLKDLEASGQKFRENPSLSGFGNLALNAVNVPFQSWLSMPLPGSLANAPAKTAEKQTLKGLLRNEVGNVLGNYEGKNFFQGVKTAAGTPVRLLHSAYWGPATTLTQYPMRVVGKTVAQSPFGFKAGSHVWEKTTGTDPFKFMPDPIPESVYTGGDNKGITLQQAPSEKEKMLEETPTPEAVQESNILKQTIPSAYQIGADTTYNVQIGKNIYTLDTRDPDTKDIFDVLPRFNAKHYDVKNNVFKVPVREAEVSSWQEILNSYLRK